LTVRIVLASANPDKAHEIRAIIGDSVVLEPRPAHVPDVVEDGSTLVDNARLKASALCDATGLPALADDTGLEVDALGGAPGVWSARYAGDHASYRDNVTKLLVELDGVVDAERTARFRTVALLRFPDGSELVADGVVEGRIARVVRGANGFGYDPVFVPSEGDGRSFAEMATDEKHAISHRGRALRALAAQINATGIR
jgi:XTP/dITP diphosphohydrolase